MTLLARLRSIAAGLLRRQRIETSMQDEIRFHIDAYADDLVRSGVPRPEAERRARIEFGGVERVRDECRQARGLRWFDDLRGDLRYAGRMLRRNPAFATVAVLSLGLGIGANTAIFSLIDTVLLKSLPVKQPERLFFIDNSGGKSRGSNAPPYPCYEILTDHNQYFSGMAAFGPDRFKVTIDGNPEQIAGQYASGSYFDVLGVPAVHGRVLTPPDDGAAVISYGLWKRRFALSPSVLGKTIHVGTKSVTIVGVTPPEFFGLEVGFPIDLTIPIMLSGNVRAKQLWWFSAVGRLKDTALPDQARADLDGMFQAYMNDMGMHGELRHYFDRIVLVPANKGLDSLRHRFSKPLLIVMTIVGLVLLIGCANVANLLLARASARQGEISVRLAIGASRGRLIRQMLTEGALLVALGGGLGILFARLGVAILVSFFAGVRNRILLDPHFDARVLAFTVALAAVTGLLFSIAPALQATRVGAAKPRLRLGQALVVVQVTLSLVLLCGAALFVRTLHNLSSLDAGFYRDGLLTLRVDATLPPGAEYARIAHIWEDLIARVNALPGVRSAGAATTTPMSGRDRGVLVAVAGGPARSENDRAIHLNHVTSGYFDAVGIRLLAGRPFALHDHRVAILNDTAARFYFGEANPIGRKVSFPGQNVTDEYEVIGVVRDTKYENLRKPVERMVYLPIEQALDRINGITVAIRGSMDTRSLVPAIRNDVSLAVPGGFVTNIATIGQQVDESLIQERLISMLASFFGALALGLASIGLYGVMSYAVVRRTREIGVRIALGARQRSVVWLVLRETFVLIVIGLALGIPAFLSANQYVKSELFGLAPGDPGAISGAILALLSVAAVAGYLPARRASRVNPMVALRYE